MLKILSAKKKHDFSARSQDTEFADYKLRIKKDFTREME